MRRDGPVVPQQIKRPQCTPGPGLERCSGRGRHFTSWWGTWPSCKVLSTGGVVRLSQSQRISVRRGGPVQNRTTLSRNFLSRAVGKSTWSSAFISNSARASTVDSPKRQIQAFVLSSGLQFQGGNKFRIDTVIMESLILKHFTLQIFLIFRPAGFLFIQVHSCDPSLEEEIKGLDKVR